MKHLPYGLWRGLGIIILVANLFASGLTVHAQAATPPPGAGLDSQVIPYSAAAPTPAAPLPAPAGSGGSPAFQVAAPLTFSDDRFNTTPTLWLVYEHQTPTDIANYINLGYRLVDISIETYTPGWTFTAVYVQNSGTYNKAWWWYYGVDVATLSSDLTANNGRLVSVKAVDIGGGAIRFAAVMIANTGADGKSWWWYVGQSISNLSALLVTNNARMTQVSAYVTGGTTQYVAVMISNTGADAANWWWYVNQTGAALSSALSTNNARLIDLDVDPTTGNFNAVMISCSGGCPLWWWYYGVSTSNLLAIADQDGARIIDATTTPGCGGDRCWAFIMIDNSNAITSRVGQMLRSQTDGTVGLYLKQVGGPVLANLEDASTFEPASAIKAVTHLYTMRKIQDGTVSLATLISMYSPPVSGSCPGNSVIGTESIQTADREMMWHSDNTRTRELNDYFGYSNVNSMAVSLGFGQTVINHIIGCGGPIANQTTLDNLAVLYEGVANATFLNTTYRSLFFSQMAGRAQFASEGYDWTSLWSTDIPNMINQEAPASMSAAARASFRAQMDLAYKAGNYKLCGPSGCAVSYVDDVAIFGWAKIPFCDGGGPRQFVFGTYIYNSTSDAGSTAAFTSTKAELLREQIHAGLASCVGQVYLPLVVK